MQTGANDGSGYARWLTECFRKRVTKCVAGDRAADGLRIDSFARRRGAAPKPPDAMPAQGFSDSEAAQPASIEARHGSPRSRG